MLYLPISRDWVVSRTAQRLYLACAIANLYFIAVLMGTFMAMAASDTVFLTDPVAVRLVRILLWPGILGTATLAVAMWYFWYSFDRSSWMARSLWFVVLILGLALGPLIYYFFAYRRSQILRKA
jgi:hypothetical protein